MPRGDQTGPMGMGPMTGRGAGFCGGFGAAGCFNPAAGQGRGLGRRGRAMGAGRGYGMGRGAGMGAGRGRGGRGRRNRFYATGLTGWQRAAMGAPAYGGYGAAPLNPAVADAPPEAPEQELEALKAQADQCEDALDAIRQRIEQIQPAPADSEKQEETEK